MDTLYQVVPGVAAVLLCILSVGCNGPATDDEVASKDVKNLAKNYLLAEEPDGAVGVIETKKALQDEPASKQVVVVAKIGGLDEPVFDPGQAAFMVADVSLDLSATDHEHEDDDCPFCQKKKQELMVGRRLCSSWMPKAAWSPSQPASYWHWKWAKP